MPSGEEEIMAIPILDTAPSITPEELGLWPPQLEAVDCMRGYIRAYRDRNLLQAALVHMPTGSGKTGVIAALVRCIPEVHGALVLTPRLGLREQLQRQIRAGFFENLSPPIDPARLPKQVIEIDTARDLQAVEDLDDVVLIATVQLVCRVREEHAAEWQRLLEHVSLLVLDEGHCEPAASWSLTIRSFPAPKIIFTATPFRNDLKIFDVDPEHIYSYTYQRALAEHILRDVEFLPMPETPEAGPFLDGVLGFYDRQFGRVRGNNRPRLIIRCDDAQEIEEIGDELEARGRRYVAIHETFSDRGQNPQRRKHVPDPRKEEADIWVHQYKLQEGIDDPRFQVLAIFTRLQNGRDLVQQVGRIIRNPAHDPHSRAYVLDHSNGHHQEMWLSFRKYDDALALYGVRAFNLQTGSAWLSGLFEAQPILTYMKYRFRTPLDLEQLTPHEELVLPRMVNLHYKRHGFDKEEFCRLLERAYREEDRLYQRYDLGEKTILYLYITFENSPLLASEFFIEPRLEITYMRDLGRYVAFYDSSGYLPVDLSEARLAKPAASADLKKLFSENDRTRLTQVSLHNSHSGQVATRAHTVRAHNLLNTVSAFDDHAHVCASITGYSQEGNERFRRYLGFARGRVSEGGNRCALGEYESWLEEVAGTLRAPRNLHETFLRYAQLANTPRNTRARHILLDLSEVEDTYVTTGKGDVPAGDALEIQDLARPVEADRRFTLICNHGREIPVKIEFERAGSRYVLASGELEEFYAPKPGSAEKRGLVSYLNQEQSFRVIPAAPNLIYMLGEYYHPPFQVGNQFRRNKFELGKVLIPVPLLAHTGSEKGRLKEQDGLWDEDTLFGIIARLGAPGGPELEKEFGDPDILVCDDMGTEAADFILGDTRSRRVVFIHAKATPSPHPTSASKLQEVIGQATKNINYLGMFNEQMPKNLPTKWNNPWKDGETGCTRPRILRGFRTGVRTWVKLRSIIRHPLAEREVWLFMGQMLSRTAFEDALAQSDVGAEALQAAHLLYAALTNVASVGAKLRVFCYP
jgi:superfamily II DNA or RNA helicase